MQLCDILLKVKGSNDHVVPKQNVTPAEIVILRELHGADAVTDIRPTQMDRRSHQQEWKRLTDFYGRNGEMSSDGKSLRLEAIFPGAIKRLPVSLDEIEQPAEQEEEADVEV